MASVDNLLLEHLKRFQATLERVETNQLETIRRISSMEHQLAGLHQDSAATNLRLDHLGQRVGLIERRLELA